MTAPISNYHDFKGLAALKREAGQSPQDAVMPVARQFEALFVQMMMKSMREATPEGGLFADSNLKTYQGMLDGQLSVSLSEQGKGIGLAQAIARQLTPSVSPAGSAATTSGAVAIARGSETPAALALRGQLRQQALQPLITPDSTFLPLSR